MSSMMLMVDPVRPARSSRLRRMGCGTEPKASFRSSQTMERFRLERRASVMADWRRKLCSKQPSKGRKPFWDGLRASTSSAHDARRRAMRAAYTLYKVFCRLIGLQFVVTFSSPFLWMRMVEHDFQAEGIFLFFRQISKIWANSLPSQSSHFHTA